jgi:chaperonin GroES
LLNKGEKMTIQPIYDRVLVKPLDPETVTKSGIVIPDNAQEKPSKGTVISVGKGRLLDNGSFATPEVSEQDIVLYGKYSGQQVKIDGEEYVVLKEEDIFGIITE